MMHTCRLGNNCMAILPKKLSLAQCNGPKIEVTYGLIGSLDFHLMWQLFMRASALSMESIDSARNTTEEDVNLRCSTILSDERILLVLSNHYRNQSKFGTNSTNLCMLTGKSKKLSVLKKCTISKNWQCSHSWKGSLYNMFKQIPCNYLCQSYHHTYVQLKWSSFAYKF